MDRRLTALGLAALLATAPSRAARAADVAAAPAPISFTVSVRVVPSCRVDALNAPVLPDMRPGQGALTAAGSVVLRCTKGTTARVIPIKGGTVLTGPAGAQLAYTLRSGTGGVWDAQHPLVGASTNALVPIALPFEARLPGGQQVPPGWYSDTVTVKIVL